MRNLPEARVARLAECHKEQKAGYGQHTSPNFPKPIPNSQHTAQILNILVEMKNAGKSDYSTKFVDKALTYLSKHANLNEPEQVKQYIANLQSKDGYKKNLCLAYNKYAKHYQIQWKMPLYTPEAKAIKIPTNEKIEMLIARAGHILSPKLQLSKETGLRPVELCRLKVRDIDLDRRLIYPTTAKHGAPRTLRVSLNLQATLKGHIEKNKLQPTDNLFKGNADDYGKHYRMMRNALADKLHDPTIKNIRLYDLRHYYATTLYAKTRDILLVKQQMGHKKNRNHTNLHATTQPKQRRMDLQNSQQHQRRNSTNRSRIRIHNRNRRKQTLPKTQIKHKSPFFNILNARA